MCVDYCVTICINVTLFALIQVLCKMFKWSASRRCIKTQTKHTYTNTQWVTFEQGTVEKGWNWKQVAAYDWNNCSRVIKGLAAFMRGQLRVQNVCFYPKNLVDVCKLQTFLVCQRLHDLSVFTAAFSSFSQNSFSVSLSLFSLVWTKNS